MQRQRDYATAQASQLAASCALLASEGEGRHHWGGTHPSQPAPISPKGLWEREEGDILRRNSMREGWRGGFETMRAGYRWISHLYTLVGDQ